MMKVAAFPAFKRKENPYQILLYKAMQANGIEVAEFNSKNILLRNFSIVHIHWPESNKLRKTIFYGIFYMVAFNFLLRVAKIKGARVVWTVHNLQPNIRKFSFLEALHFGLFTKAVDALIFMNRSGVEKIFGKYPVLQNKPYKIIPHGHYKNWYPNKITRSEARRFFNLPETDNVFLVLGEIKPYKGLENLIEAFRKFQCTSYKLFIAGNVQDLSYKEKIERLIGEDERINFNAGFIANEKLQYYFNASDVVLLPYTSMLNSGALLLSLSFNKTIAMPYFDSLSEIEDEYRDWLLTYDTLDKYVFEKALLKSKQNSGKEINMQKRNWDVIAFETIAFYKSILK